jgi:hypothetical protein
MNLLHLRLVCSLLLLVAAPSVAFAQGTTNDIPTAQLPAEVRTVLHAYIELLRNSDSLDECAEQFRAVAGGSLVNEDGRSLRSNVKPYGLKKDFENVKFYANPVNITRVNRNPSISTSGFGPSALRGNVFKVWIAKAEGQAGIPAPISILVPEGGGTPKVVSIGSL